jgi:ferric-dicitrate binding protein FerR (iron transport regulator)
MTQAELKRLIDKYLTEDLSEEDFQRLWATLREPEHKDTWMEMIAGVWDNPAYHSLADDTAKQRVLEKLRPALTEIPAPPVRQPLIRRLTANRSAWWAAAVVILMCCAGAWYFLSHQPQTQLADNLTDTTNYKNDVAPGNNKAVLTLGDGSTVALDSAGNQVIRQGNTAIHQQNGLLQYKSSGANAGVSYNTLTTPRGGKFRIVLPDGTGVWLNAASSIRYPVAFTGKERRVEITGEAYFEVAQQAAMPFIVSVNNKAEVEVLGTHFNINAYQDEAAINTTLLVGKVRVSAGTAPGTVLQPGQQASLNTAGTMKVLNDIDTMQIIAWKEGWFQFHMATLPDVMRQLSRWYDVDVKYPANIPDRAFEGRIQQDLTLTQILKILERYQVHFRVEGRQITVLPE